MELQKKIEEMGTAFEAFKKTNDAAIAEAKASGGKLSAETQEKLEKQEKHIAGLETKITELNAALSRGAGNGDDRKDEHAEKDAKYKEALDLFMRKGAPISQELVVHAASRASGKSMATDSEADGGFLVTPETSSEIVKKVFESSPVRQLASVQTISSSSLKINEDLDEASSGWTSERGARTATNTPQLKQIEIAAEELYANPQATQQFLDDAAINVEAWLSGKVSEKFGRDEATAFISGTGVGKPRGILSYTAGDGFGLIQHQTCATASVIIGEDLIDIQTKLKEPYQGNATWLINRLLIGVIRKLKDATTGQYIWQPGLQVSAPNVLLGRPVMMASDLPSTIGTGSQIGIYGDFKAGYQVVDRVGIRVLRDPFSNKPYVQFYTTKRVGGGVKNFEALKVLKSL